VNLHGKVLDSTKRQPKIFAGNQKSRSPAAAYEKSPSVSEPRNRYGLFGFE
jgi:hypothetical protein